MRSRNVLSSIENGQRRIVASEGDLAPPPIPTTGPADGRWGAFSGSRNSRTARRERSTTIRDSVVVSTQVIEAGIDISGVGFGSGVRLLPGVGRATPGAVEPRGETGGSHGDVLDARRHRRERQGGTEREQEEEEQSARI